MKFEFADDELEELYTDPSSGGDFSQAIVKGFRRRVQNISEAKDLRDLRYCKGNRLEKLTGKRKHQHSMMLTGNWRLIIEVMQDKVTAIKIVEIVDYH